MKRWMVAVLVALASFGVAKADDGRTNALIKFADVLAIKGRCPKLELNMEKLKVLAVVFGIDVRRGTPDAQVLESMVKGKRLELESMTDDEVCAAGAFLYGPNGVNMEGLLSF